MALRNQARPFPKVSASLSSDAFHFAPFRFQSAQHAAGDVRRDASVHPFELVAVAMAKAFAASAGALPMSFRPVLGQKPQMVQ